MPVMTARVPRSDALVEFYAGDLRKRLRGGDLLVHTRDSKATRLTAEGAIEEVEAHVLRFHWLED